MYSFYHMLVVTVHCDLDLCLWYEKYFSTTQTYASWMHSVSQLYWKSLFFVEVMNLSCGIFSISVQVTLESRKWRIANASKYCRLIGTGLLSSCSPHLLLRTWYLCYMFGDFLFQAVSSLVQWTDCPVLAGPHQFHFWCNRSVSSKRNPVSEALETLLT